MRRHLTAFMACLPAMFLATLALAAEAEHGHGEGGVPIATILFSTINLLIFAFVLNRYAVPAVRLWVRTRRNLIVTELEEAAAARGEALRLKAEWEERIAKLGETIRQMRDQARQDAERERERILADAHRFAEAIHRDAERTIAAEVRTMRAELRAKVVREAVRLAEEQVRQKWTPADQERFVSEFVRQVGK
jgi:F-type H+-transporting ATPase subunit b